MPNLKSAIEIVGSRQITDPAEINRLKTEGVSEQASVNARRDPPPEFEVPGIPEPFSVDRETQQRAGELAQAINERGLKFNAERIAELIAELEPGEQTVRLYAERNFGSPLTAENLGRFDLRHASEGYRLEDRRVGRSLLDWARISRTLSFARRVAFELEAGRNPVRARVFSMALEAKMPKRDPRAVALSELLDCVELFEPGQTLFSVETPYLQLVALAQVVGDPQLLSDYQADCQASGKWLEAPMLATNLSRPDLDLRRFSIFNCELSEVEPLIAARRFLAERPAWEAWQKVIGQSTSRGGGLESIGWRHPDPSAAAQARDRIFGETLASSHMYIATEICRQLPQAVLLSATEDLFIVAAPEVPSELVFSRLPSLQFQIQEGGLR